MKKDPNVIFSSKIDQYPQWQNTAAELREILQNSELKEEIKWNMLTYTHRGKNVIGLGIFKDHCGLWFFQGSLLKDSQNILVNAQKGKTQYMRHWKFYQGDTIPEHLINDYIKEAIKVSETKNLIKKKKHKLLEIPSELREVLNVNNQRMQYFEGLTVVQRNDFITYYTSAKRESTKVKRLHTIVNLLDANQTLHSKYQK